MHGERFDRIARVVADRFSRRQALGTVAAAAGFVFGSNAATVRGAVEGERRRCRPEKERRVRQEIRAASRRYKQKYKSMLCVAKCESTLNNCAVDPSGSFFGLFQFVPSTFESTPFGRKDIFDPKWNARAAGWMWKEGRQNEWTCCTQDDRCNCPKR